MGHVFVCVSRAIGHRTIAGPKAQFTLLRRCIVHLIRCARFQNGCRTSCRASKVLTAIGRIGKLTGRRANVTAWAGRIVGGRYVCADVLNAIRSRWIDGRARLLTNRFRWAQACLSLTDSLRNLYFSVFHIVLMFYPLRITITTNKAVFAATRYRRFDRCNCVACEEHQKASDDEFGHFSLMNEYGSAAIPFYTLLYKQWDFQNHMAITIYFAIRKYYSWSLQMEHVHCLIFSFKHKIIVGD